MDNYIIRDTKHFLFWNKENKKDTTIFDDITSILYDRIKTLQEKINNNYDTSINIELSRELCKLESIIDRFIDKNNVIDEIFVDINNMECKIHNCSNCISSRIDIINDSNSEIKKTWCMKSKMYIGIDNYCTNHKLS